MRASAKELGDEALFKHIAHLQLASAVLLASAELKLHMATQGNKLETCAQAVELIKKSTTRQGRIACSRG